MTMSFGKMNTFITIVAKQHTTDDEGFKTESDVTVAEVWAYREGRHGSEKWANMAQFSTATDLSVSALSQALRSPRKCESSVTGIPLRSLPWRMCAEKVCTLRCWSRR